MAKKSVVLFLMIALFGCGFSEVIQSPCPHSDECLVWMPQPVLIIVRASWSLQDIAWGVGMDIKLLIEMNGLQNPDDIFPGQILKAQPYSDRQEVIVSWYQDGTQRADGQLFDPNDETVVAHKWLPFGTQVRLTLIGRNRSIIVTVCDRGPYIDGRDFDLSRGAAIQFGIILEGIARCSVEIIGSSD